MPQTDGIRLFARCPVRVLPARRTHLESDMDFVDMAFIVLFVVQIIAIGVWAFVGYFMFDIGKSSKA